MLKIEINNSNEVYELPENWSEVSSKQFMEYLKLSDELEKGKIASSIYLLEVLKSFMNVTDETLSKFEGASIMELFKQLDWITKPSEKSDNLKISKK